MKKLAILLSFVVLLTSLATVGLTSLAEESTGRVIFETDFSTDTVTGIAALNDTGWYYGNNSAGTRTNKIIDGAWEVNETARVDRWRGAFGTYSPAVPMAWSEGQKYLIEFDWSITGYAESTAALRAIIDTDMGMNANGDGTRAYQYKVIEEAVHTGTDSGKVTWEVTLSAETALNAISDGAALRVVFRGLGMTSFTIDNLKITDLSYVPGEDDNDEPANTVLFEDDFAGNALPDALLSYAADGAKCYTNVAVADGVLTGSAPVANSDWSNMFRTDSTKIPLTWETAGNNAYKIEFDWTLPQGTDNETSAEMRVLFTTADGATRADQIRLYKGVQAAGTSGRFEQTVLFNGPARVNGQAFAADGDHLIELIFIAKYSPAVTIDNLKITNVSPADPEQEEIGTETVILDTDFSTATVDGLLALGGGTARYYGDAEGDVNGIVDGAWKSSKVKYAEDNVTKKQWYSAWGTHTTENPIVWGQNYAYRVEFDWSIPVACENSQFRVIMECADLSNPSINDNRNPRPYQVGVYNTDGTCSEAGYAITQTEASSGSFKATFAVNNLNLKEENTPANGQTMRILIRAQLESFTIDNLKITRVAIAPDVKQEEEKPPVEEDNTKVLLDTDFTSVPLGLGNTWGGAYEVSGVNDEKDVWESDSEETPTGWKMIFNTVYNIVPIVWGEGHSYKIELSYSLPKGSGENGRFELVLDKDDGTQANRGWQKSVFKATPDKMIEAGETVYTYEVTINTSGDAANKADGGVLTTDDHMMLKFMAKTLPAINIHSVKITDLNAALTPEIILPGVDDTEEEVSQPINVWIKITDDEGKPLSGQPFKLDANEMQKLDANGCFKFENVVSGAYTINLTDADGNIIVSAYYTILAGDTTDIFGNFATIDSTVTDLYITMLYSGGQLTVEDMTVESASFGGQDWGISDDADNVILGDDVQSPETGVAFPTAFVVVMLLAGMVVVLTKKSRVLQ